MRYLLYFILFCSALSIPSCDWGPKEYDVFVDYELYYKHYIQMEVRLQNWTENWGLSNVESPIPSQYFKGIKWKEFVSTETTTCYFNSPDIIIIGNDKWDSGCVAHEIGHYILYQIKHPCWGEFEHEREKDKCLKRF